MLLRAEGAQGSRAGFAGDALCQSPPYVLTVRLAELLPCPRLIRLRLIVTALHDSAAATVSQLRACAWQELDITLLTIAPGELRRLGRFTPGHTTVLGNPHPHVIQAVEQGVAPASRAT